jgi:uncharacterized protein with FMN-binding domain
MKKIVYGLLATVSGLVLLFSYRTSLEAVAPAAAQPAADAASTSSGRTSTGDAAGSTGSTDQGSTSPGTSTASGIADGTYTGASAQTRFGPVQVEITVSGGSIADVRVVEYPDNNGRDRQINETAIPRLVSETLEAQNAQIDMVSGATYTSQGYLTSLQSAIDQATS